MPYVGHVPGKEGQMIMAGYSGRGMALILLSAKAIAQMLRHGKTLEETGVPSMFKPTPERLASTKNEILGTSDHVSAKSKL